jgi:hypothetical protein
MPPAQRLPPPAHPLPVPTVVTASQRSPPRTPPPGQWQCRTRQAVVRRGGAAAPARGLVPALPVRQAPGRRPAPLVLVRLRSSSAPGVLSVPRSASSAPGRAPPLPPPPGPTPTRRSPPTPTPTRRSRDLPVAVASGVPRLRRCAACGCVCHRLGFPRLAGGTQGLDPRPAMRATWCLHQLEAAAAAMQRASPRMGDTLHVGLRTARGRSGADWESSTPGTAFSWTGPPPPCVGSSWLFLMCLRFHIPDVSPCVSLYHLRSAVVDNSPQDTIRARATCQTTIFCPCTRHLCGRE